MPDPRLHRLLAEARASELRGAAARRPMLPPLPRPGASVEQSITLRYGFPDDAEPLARLAALDSAAVPRGPILLAEVGGELRAALSLADGAVIADPFYATGTLVDLLGARAWQLRQSEMPGRRSRVRWWGRLRLPALR